MENDKQLLSELRKAYNYDKRCKKTIAQIEALYNKYFGEYKGCNCGDPTQKMLINLRKKIR